MNRGVAIVTGGGRGIGEATAAALAAGGVAVAVVARTQAEVDQAAARIRSSGGDAVALPADVSDADSAAELVATAEQRLGGRVDILVNAAGVTGPVGELAEIDTAGWQQVMAINLTGAFAMCRAVLPGMRDRASGRIVNVISGLAHRVQVGLGPYAASKAALLHLSRIMDAENKHVDVRVFAIEPGVVETEMNRSLMTMETTGVRASVVRMLRDLAADPGFVQPEESAQLIRMAATGQADELAGDAHSIYEPAVRARLSAA
jgi:NAD(P)-dependent dehydrogenase (short-subunit alcohol dehydrogenase family)